MLEVEINFADNLWEMMDFVEETLRNVTRGMYEKSVTDEIMYGKRITQDGVDVRSSSLSLELERRWQGIIGGKWPRISYAVAIDILQQSRQEFQHNPTWETGLQAEHERFLAVKVGKGKPVFVTNYPKEIKPFYMLQSATTSDSKPTVECFDLIVPEACEIAGGSMREHRLPQLLDSMRSHGLISDTTGATAGDLPPDEALGSLKWYVDLRQWGSAPHGGFGIGFDRLLGYLSGVPNIRDVVTFPRWVGRCDC
jgi:asparaginyl-tRNA synthetase